MSGSFVAGLLAVLAAISIAFDASAAQSQPVATKAAIKPLRVGSLAIPYCTQWGSYCSRIERPLDPLGRVPGTIKIFFVYDPHQNRKQPSKGLLVAVEGGPGYPSTGTRGSYRKMYGPLLEDYDLLTVDARGTGSSDAINCGPLQTAPTMTEALVADCGRQLGSTAPLYSTALAADDLAALLDQLGVAQINLYGDSYGTYFGQTFAYRHPQRLRSLVLDSAYPVPMIGGETPFYPYFAPTMRRSMNLVCARSPECARQGSSDTMARAQPVIDALRAKPFTQWARNSAGKRVKVDASATALASVMMTGASPYEVGRDIDAALRAFMADDRDPLLRLMADITQTQDARAFNNSPRYFSSGMFAAVACQDYAQLYDMTLPPVLRRQQRDAVFELAEKRQPDMYAPFTYDEFRGMPLDYTTVDVCASWPAVPTDRPHGPPVPRAASMPDIPVLVTNGELDTITTPEEGRAAASQFLRAKPLLLANSFHLTAVPPSYRDTCGTDILRHFVATLQPGDTSCAARVAPLRTPPQFARQYAAFEPAQAQPGNEANEDLLRAAAAAVWTVGDALGRIESVGRTAAGLRGGRIDIRWGGIYIDFRLDEARFTDDLTVSGRIHWAYRGGASSARLRLKDAGSQKVSGELAVYWPEGDASGVSTIRGVLNGHKVKAQTSMP